MDQARKSELDKLFFEDLVDFDSLQQEEKEYVQNLAERWSEAVLSLYKRINGRDKEIESSFPFLL